MPGLTTFGTADCRKNPYLLLAAGDGFLGQCHIRTIRVVTAGASGAVILQDRATGGRDIWRSSSVNSNSSDETNVGDGQTSFDGCFATNLPAGAIVYLYIE